MVVWQETAIIGEVAAAVVVAATMATVIVVVAVAVARSKEVVQVAPTPREDLVLMEVRDVLCCN